jgi:hypothetical protein
MVKISHLGGNYTFSTMVVVTLSRCMLRGIDGTQIKWGRVDVLIKHT